MSAPAVIKKPDLKRAAEVANETGCSIEIKLGATVYTIHPGKPIPVDGKTDIRL
ncbi:MAG: hypothetical protein H6887_09255 [Hoeflea sp.]|nr:hypothetical protein [Hoeflea sp.]